MRCAKNDTPVRDRSTTDTGDSTVWLGDRFDCPTCEASIVTGFGAGRAAADCPESARDAIEFRY